MASQEGNFCLKRYVNRSKVLVPHVARQVVALHVLRQCLECERIFDVGSREPFSERICAENVQVLVHESPSFLSRDLLLCQRLLALVWFRVGKIPERLCRQVVDVSVTSGRAV